MVTPNLDRLVRGGVSFDRCYGQSPVCMPSRASFMSGCYPSQTGLMLNGQDLAADFPLTMARAIKPHYTTVQYGKLHFHWPRALAAQRVTGLTEMVDVLPTMLGLAQLPIDRRMAGCDLSAELLSGTPPQGRSDVIAMHGGKDLMLRTQPWKYLRW